MASQADLPVAAAATGKNALAHAGCTRLDPSGLSTLTTD